MILVTAVCNCMLEEIQDLFCFSLLCLKINPDNLHHFHSIRDKIKTNGNFSPFPLATYSFFTSLLVLISFALIG